MNAIIEKLKQIRFLRTAAELPWLKSMYHWAWAFFGALRFGFPSRRLIVVGVTGTKGKTSTLELINAMLETAGHKTALASSLRIKVAGTSRKNSSGNSMPGRDALQRFLRDAVRASCKYALVEVTSEGVKVHRHRFIRWNAGVLTNLAPEHIESHGSFEKYRAAKLAFLMYVGRQHGRIYLNSNDKNADFFAAETAAYHPRFYEKKDAEQVLRSATGNGATPADLIKKFNEENIAAASAVVHDLGLSNTIIAQAIATFEGVPGRMEFVQEKPFAAVVDYAHTPDSQKKAYAALREMIGAEGKLICVFGSCGGGRDKWKRPAMGEVAARACDYIVLTNEDPFDEDPMEILNQVEYGFSHVPEKGLEENKNYWKVLDRQKALEKAVSLARPGDAVIMTGKGSESSIRLAGGKTMPWDEKSAVLKAIGAVRA